MKKKSFIHIIGFVFIIGLSTASLVNIVYAGAEFQIPTVSVPTVTSSPVGPVIIVKNDPNEPQINVRSGPGTAYEKIGLLLAGEQAPAKGRTQGGDWILIVYPGVVGGLGWVYAPLVDIRGGPLGIVEPPPTPSPQVTITIDPTLAAQFIVTQAPSRMPTFTEPPPLVIPTYTDTSGANRVGNVPMGMIIIAIAMVGVILGFVSLARSR